MVLTGQSELLRQFWKGSRICPQELNTVQLTSPNKATIATTEPSSISYRIKQTGPGEKQAGGLVSLHCLLIPAWLHTSSMLCSMSTSPALPRTCHRDVNLSLAHTLNILLAPGSEEGFISRGFLHSSFFNCLSGTLGLLPL